MQTYRIGVIADTHTPEFLPALPKGINHHFQGVDLILHAGDITGTQVLEELRAIAPVTAVKGDHDKLELPLKTVIEIGSKRIGLIHGRRPRWRELPGMITTEIFPSHHFWWGGFHRQVLQQFQDVDAIVFGHFHRPYVSWHNRILLFNPGGVYQLTPARAKIELAQPQSLSRRLYLLNALRHVALTPTVGLLTVIDGTIEAEILPL